MDRAAESGVAGTNTGAVDTADPLAAIRAGLADQPNNPQLRTRLASLLLERGDVPGAEAAARAGLTQFPNHLALLNTLGMSLERQGRQAEALEVAARAAKADPSVAWVQARHGELLLAAGRAGEAERAYRDAVARAPTAPGPLVGLSRALQRQGRAAEALEAAARAAKADSTAPSVQAHYGELLLAAGRVGEAERVYRDALAHAPAAPGPLVGLSKALQQQGRQAEALEVAARVAEANLTVPWVQAHYGELLMAAGRLGEAERVYRNALARTPTAPGPVVGLSKALQQQGRQAEALQVAAHAAKANPTAPWAQTRYGELLLAAAQVEEADAVFGAVLAHEPGNLQALMGRGHCARHHNSRAAALEFFQRAARKHPKDPWARLHMATELRTLGRDAEAEAVYRSVLTDQPDLLPALLGLGICARQRGDRAEALQHFRAAAAAHPANALPRVEIATELRNSGDFAAACELYEVLIRENPANPDLCLQLARTHQLAGQLKPAANCLEDGISRFPDSSQLRMQLARVQRLLGLYQDSEKTLDALLERNPGDIDAMVERAESNRFSWKFDLAETWLNQALALDPRNTPALLGLSLLWSEQGRFTEALDLLDKHFPDPLLVPGAAKRRIGILAQFGHTKEALRLARDLARTVATDFQARFEHLRLETLAGNLEFVEGQLPDLPVQTTQDRSMVCWLRGQIAELRWHLADAVRHYSEAQKLDSLNREFSHSLARCLLMRLDLSAAQNQLARFAALQAPVMTTRGQPFRASQAMMGRLLNEYHLADEMDELRAAAVLPAGERSEALRQIVQRQPQSTAAAIVWLVALREEGVLQARIRGTGNACAPIPRRIAQFWDGPCPDDVRGLMQSWPDLNPQFEYELFDNSSAQTFLQCHTPALAQAYRRARLPAEKADIFRLAWLYTKGGFYADADDRCVAPIEDEFATGADLVVTDDYVGSIANNFIGAAPQHPVLRQALDFVVQSANRGDSEPIWLRTGPGMLTRAFTNVMAESHMTTATWLQSIDVLGTTELRRAVSPHCATGYKKTGRHWGNPLASGRASDTPGTIRLRRRRT